MDVNHLSWAQMREILFVIPNETQNRVLNLKVTEFTRMEHTSLQVLHMSSIIRLAREWVPVTHEMYTDDLFFFHSDVHSFRAVTPAGPTA